MLTVVKIIHTYLRLQTVWKLFYYCFTNAINNFLENLFYYIIETKIYYLSLFALFR